MLQTLLLDRFRLAFHRETRDIPVYALVVAKNGPKLAEAKPEGPSDVEPGEGDDLHFQRISMELLCNVIAQSLDRQVLDQTNLKGFYDFQLGWAERPRKAPRAAPPPEAGEAGGAPSIFTALPSGSA